VSEAQLLTDAVICGHDHDFIAALAWLNQAEARRLLEREDDVPLDDPAPVAHLSWTLGQMKIGAGSVMRVQRLLLLAEPPRIDAGEITDRGDTNNAWCASA